MSDESGSTTQARATTISGRALVIAMVAFALTLVVIMRWYWNKHIEPFMPLQLAIAEQFENSSPRVEGGQRKMHKESPRILRVTMRVPYDPTDRSEESLARIATDLDTIVDIAKQHVPLSDFSLVECHLYMPDPGKSLRQAAFTRTLE